MFEKISGFFKQFTSRRKKQSGETTIMPSKEGAPDEFGLDTGFGDIEDTGGYDAGDLDLDTFGDTGGAGEGDDFGVGGEFPDTDGFADTMGVGDLGSKGEDMPAQDTGIESEPRVEDAFSDFDLTEGDADISTGGTDFDERTVSDEISGLTGGEFEETGADFDSAFDAGGVASPAEPKTGSPIKAVLTVAIAAVIAIGVGAAFQLFAWESISEMVGLASTDKVQVDPQARLADEGRKKGRLTKELGEYTKVGAPAQVQALKKQAAEVRDAQGPINKVEADFSVVQGKEAAYDALLKRVSGLEADNKKTATDVGNVKAKIEDTKKRVIALAKRTEEEYERFRFELTRAEFGKRLLIELRLRDIASFKADVAKLEQRLSKLSVKALNPTPVVNTLPEQPVATEISDN